MKAKVTKNAASRKLVDYVYNNLLGGNNEKITICKDAEGDFYHYRDNNYHSDIFVALNFIESPKTKKEIKSVIEFHLSNRQD
jgi:hypothetical protein